VTEAVGHHYDKKTHNNLQLMVQWWVLGHRILLEVLLTSLPSSPTNFTLVLTQI
jgi:hypothetical protein